MASDGCRECECNDGILDCNQDICSKYWILPNAVMINFRYPSYTPNDQIKIW